MSETWYAVVNPDGRVVPRAISTLKEHAIELFLVGPRTWKDYQAQGYRVQAYRVTPISEEGGEK